MLTILLVSLPALASPESSDEVSVAPPTEAPRPQLSEVSLLIGGGLGFQPRYALLLDADGSGLWTDVRDWRPEDSGPAQLRLDLLTRVDLPGDTDLTASLGLVNSDWSTHLPLAVGPEWALGPLRAGAQANLLFGSWPDCGGGRGMAVSGGLSGSLAYARPLGDHLSLDARLLGGWTSGPLLHAGLGLGWRP